MARDCGLVAVILLGCVVSGCSRGSPGMVPVSGRVTFGGTNPPATVELYFAPAPVEDAAASVPQRAGRAIASPNGTFQVSSLREGDGLLPGTYEVRLVCWRTPPNANHEGGGPDSAGVSFLPVGFAAPSLTIEPGSRRAVRYDLDVVAATSATVSPGTPAKAR